MGDASSLTDLLNAPLPQFIPTTAAPAANVLTFNQPTNADSPPETHHDDDVDHYAEIVYNYHRMSLPLPAKPVDAIFCLCSLDLRVAVRAAELFLAGHSRGRHLIFSGGVGALTANRFPASEAEAFAEVAVAIGVPRDAIILEKQSTNTGENVRFAYDLLRTEYYPRLGGEFKSFILVQKPYMERRTYATFVKQWPAKDSAEFCVTSPELEWRDYPDADNPRDKVINIMVGDLVRLRTYPSRGFQIKQFVDDDTWCAVGKLLDAGYDRHLPGGAGF